jgi:membrane-associated phospholipid phosphatase
LLATAARPWAGALLACCVILVAVLGVLFAHQGTADSLDRAIDAPIITWFDGHQGLLLWLAAPGSSILATALCAAIVLGCLFSGRPNGAVLAALALPAAVGLDDGLLKHLFHRTYLGQLAYPSGHTTAIFTLATATAVVVLGPLRPARAGPLRVAVPAIACGLGVLVAVGVIGLQWHYFTDTVAGAAVGIAVVCGLALLLDLPAAREQLARIPNGARLVQRGP